MRAGFEASLETAPDETEGYAKGSTVLCAHCFVPLYVLTRTISPLEKANRTVDAYRPITLAQLNTLRRDVPSVTAALKTWSFVDSLNHVCSVRELRTGSPAACPKCERSFVQVFAPEEQEVIDAAYTWRLVTIPPLSAPYPIRSSRLDLH